MQRPVRRPNETLALRFGQLHNAVRQVLSPWVQHSQPGGPAIRISQAQRIVSKAGGVYNRDRPIFTNCFPETVGRPRASPGTAEAARGFVFRVSDPRGLLWASAPVFWPTDRRPAPSQTQQSRRDDARASLAASSSPRISAKKTYSQGRPRWAAIRSCSGLCRAAQTR
jgi:hypothetical protein